MITRRKPRGFGLPQPTPRQPGDGGSETTSCIEGAPTFAANGGAEN